MKIGEFLKNHEDWVLGAIAVCIAAVIVGIFIWGVGYLATDIGSAIGNPVTGAVTSGFNLDAARQLDFKGVPQ